jgi:transposase InsO family protein
MSWKETCAMSERIRMISDYLTGDYGPTELALKYGVSRKTVTKWINRHRVEGWDGLADQSRAPHHHPNAVAPAIEQLLLELKARWPLWGAPKLRQKLLDTLGPINCPAESTISEILRRHGLSRMAKRRRRAVPSEAPLGHCLEANRVWCADFKGWFRTQDGNRCTPLTITDGHSRFLLRCQGLGGSTGWLTVKPLFIEAFREYGLPVAIRTDNGPPFATATLGGLSVLSVWWLRLGIGLERIEPGKPQQNGRHERMHRTLKEATAKPSRSNLRTQQQAFDRFREEYNHHRPHEALGQKPPAEFYAKSERQYPERLPEPRGYPDDWQKRVVREAGQIKWKGRNVNLTQALWGQQVGFKPVGDGRWTIYFESLELGEFDERTGRVKAAKRLTFNPQTA